MSSEAWSRGTASNHEVACAFAALGLSSPSIAPQVIAWRRYQKGAGYPVIGDGKKRIEALFYGFTSVPGPHSVVTRTVRLGRFLRDGRVIIEGNAADFSPYLWAPFEDPEDETYRRGGGFS